MSVVLFLQGVVLSFRAFPLFALASTHEECSQSEFEKYSPYPCIHCHSSFPLLLQFLPNSPFERRAGEPVVPHRIHIRELGIDQVVLDDHHLQEINLAFTAVSNTPTSSLAVSYDPPGSSAKLRRAAPPPSSGLN
jgi:hypothetical protein